MGEGALVGMPLQLAGTRKILEFMDWGEYGALGDFIKIGSIGICFIRYIVHASFSLVVLPSKCTTY